MGRGLGIGPSSMEGLRWLVKVGPCPLDAWAAAMGWSDVAARSHARRLEDQGWLLRYPMVRGDGSLFVATRAGVKETKLRARPVRGATVTLWRQHCAVAWTASWIRANGYHVIGARELLESPEWTMDLRWHDRNGYHQAIHRPLLVAISKDGEDKIAIEIDTTTTSKARLRQTLSGYGYWQISGRIDSLLYVCETKRDTERIRELARWAGLSKDSGTLMRRQLDTIRNESRLAHHTRPSVQKFRH
jgi:hypothetical protein